MDVAIIDLETTGLDPIYDLIVEIGIVELNLLTGETRVLFDSVVKEQTFGEEYRNSWIFENSDLTFEVVQNAPLFDDIIPDIQDILTKYSVTAFNKLFDLGFLKARGITMPNELPCIMLTATNILKIPFLRSTKEFKWPNCQEAWNYFFPNSYYIEQHRALDDARHEAMIFFEIYRRGLLPAFKEIY